VISGAQEVLIDDIKKFCAQLKKVQFLIHLTYHKSGCLVVEEHRNGKSHDWWWADFVMYGLFDYFGTFECNELMKSFIVGSM
jgi:hypothetical protein